MAQRMRWGWMLVACLAVGAMPGTTRAGGRTLAAFANEAQFQQQLARWRAEAERAERLARRAAEQQAQAAAAAPPMPAPAPGAPLERVVVTGSVIASPVVTGAALSDASITNVQTTGVDEGDIVKHAGDYLLVLRRGRIFSIRVAGDRLEPVDHVDAFAPDANPARTWYDEMLVSGRTVVVIGYSYERGGTEIGLFDLLDDGHLRYRATYQMRSDDYYSSRNYASRLIGTTLILYTPLEVDVQADTATYLPAVRRWHRGATPADFHRILPADRIYRSPGDLRWDDDLVLHAVNVCDLAAPTMRCTSTAVLGPAERAFYVSGDSVFVWTTPDAHPADAGVMRIPLDGSAPTALRTRGSPVDQMAFLQRDGVLNVLVGSEAHGEAMWRSNGRTGELALLRVPLDRFGDGRDAAREDEYRPLPDMDGWRWDLHNRFVGDWLVYGAEISRRDGTSVAAAVRYASDSPPQVLQLAHPVERIDAMGHDAILVGAKGTDLHFTSVRLGERAEAVASFVQQDAVQGDDRSHGFFYRPLDEDDGLVGLPTIRSVRNGDEPTSSAVLFLRNRHLRLSRAGSLGSMLAPNAHDGCQVSCVDWYGNARPIFLGDRIFALLGYEIVEGRMRGERIVESRRASFDPTPVARPSGRAAK